MRIVLLIVGPLFIAVGLFWFGQGTGSRAMFGCIRTRKGEAYAMKRCPQCGWMQKATSLKRAAGRIPAARRAQNYLGLKTQHRHGDRSLICLICLICDG